MTSEPPPWIHPDISRWIGPRQYCYQLPPNPPNRSVAIVSSRVTRPLYEQHEWFGKLRRTLKSLTNSNSPLLTTPKTSTHRFLTAYAVKHGIPVAQTTFCQCHSHWINQTRDPTSFRPYECVISPLTQYHLETNVILPHLPLRDRLLVGGAHQLYVLDARPLSKTAQLLGYRTWCTIHCEPSSHAPSAAMLPASRGSTETYPLAPVPDWFTRHSSLAHWTRAVDGPWPGQSAESWINQLIDGNKQANHSAIATLTNIVVQQRILGSCRTIREGHKVVCLTAVPLHQWPLRAVYRSHLRRWDFCPYGILLGPRAVKMLNPRKVSYGGEELWKTLPPADRPFFQANDCQIDWRVEQEYRIVGDLDLSHFQPDDLIVFTKTQAEANTLQSNSIWPVFPFDYLAELAKIQA